MTETGVSMDYTLPGLPLDALIHIQNLLEPLDIIALRKTCKALYTASLLRNVWLNALQRVCASFGILEITFPFERMARDAIEHAALAPSRFVSHLRKERSPSVLTEFLPSFATRILRTPPDVEDLFLVPGGRYLLTMSRPPTFPADPTIQLWDLGYSPSCTINPFPIASLTCVGSIGLVGTQATPDGRGIRVVTFTDTETLLVAEYGVYEIYPASLSPKLDRIATLPTPENIGADGCGPDMVAFQDRNDGVITVWDFAKNARISWQAVEEFISIIISQGHVVVLGQEYLAIWKIPPLRPRDAPYQTPLSDYPAIALVPHSFGHLGGMPKLAINPWLPRDRPLSHFAVIGDFIDTGGCGFRYFTITATGSPNDDDGVNFTVTLNKHTQELQLKMSDAHSFSLIFSGEDQIICWKSGEVFVGVFKAPIAEDDPIILNPVKLAVELSGYFESAVKLWCPASGRMCLNGKEGEIRVIDFIIPPCYVHPGSH